MNTNARTAYMDASVATSDPQSLLIMLYDRLVLDLQRALAAQEAQDHPQAHNQLVHAQDIVAEFRGTLRVDAFAAGVQLAALYDYLLQRLVQANLGKDAAITTECLSLAIELRDTWRQAALQLRATA